MTCNEDISWPGGNALLSQHKTCAMGTAPGWNTKALVLLQCVYSSLMGDTVQHSEPSAGVLKGFPKGSSDPMDSFRGKEMVLVSP